VGDILSASSLLLATIGILYGFWYNDLANAKDTKIPDHAANCTAPRIKVSRIVWTRALPLAAASALLAVVFLPDAIKLIAASCLAYAEHGFSFARYDAVHTAFCVVVGFKVVLAIHLLILFLQLYSLRRQLRKKEGI
jgi:hypothetical protein